jgi:hypothetical protein
MQRKDADQGRRRSTERSAVSRRASVQCLLHDYVNQDCRRPAVEFVLVSAQRCSPVRCVTSAQRQSGSSLTSPDGPSRKAAGKLRCRNAAEATASASIGLDLPALGYPAAGDRGPASVAPSGRSCFSLQVRCRRSLGAAADCGRCPANATGPRSSAWPTNAPAARPGCPWVARLRNSAGVTRRTPSGSITWSRGGASGTGVQTAAPPEGLAKPACTSHTPLEHMPRC